MAKRLSIYSFCFLIAIALSGCMTLGRKAQPMPFGETSLTIPGEIESFHEKYKTSYVVWKALCEELIQQLGGNRMRTLNTREQMILTLEKMQSYLTDEGRDLLAPHIEGLRTTTEELMKRRLNRGQIGRLKRELNKEKVEIEKRFSYRKAKEWIRLDVEEIPPEYLEGEE